MNLHDQATAFARGLLAKPLARKIVLVDVGASAGLQGKWRVRSHSIAPVLFEPNPTEAAKLRAKSGKDATVFEFALSDTEGEHDLHLTSHPGTSSMLKPNMAFLNKYVIAPLFAEKSTIRVTCRRYDKLVEQGLAARPDVIKIDIEGYESHALAGFGRLLDTVLGIETEAWFQEARLGQALLHDLIDQLLPFGLRLRRVEEVPGFEGDLVCVNAYFTQSANFYQALDDDRRAQFDVLSSVWSLKR